MHTCDTLKTATMASTATTSTSTATATATATALLVYDPERDAIVEAELGGHDVLVQIQQHVDAACG